MSKLQGQAYHARLHCRNLTHVREHEPERLQVGEGHNIVSCYATTRISQPTLLDMRERIIVHDSVTECRNRMSERSYAKRRGVEQQVRTYHNGERLHKATDDTSTSVKTKSSDSGPPACRSAVPADRS